MTVAPNSLLVQKIKQAILASPRQAISFAEYMEWVLYEPSQGYYASRCNQLGPAGDFVTSPHLCSDYGELIALQLLEFWEVLGRPTPFTVVEMGAGQGLISADVLEFLSRHSTESALLMSESLDWRIVERSPAMVRWQKQYITRRLDRCPVTWTTLEALAASPITGCIFSNELVDAFPVHILEMVHGNLLEQWVVLNLNPESAQDEPFQEKYAELSNPHLWSYFEEISIDMSPQLYPDGYRCEVNLAACAWIEQVSDALARGFVLTVDYGYRAQQLYSPARIGGTLQCYSQQKSHDRPFIRVGNQDITSHVNFSALEVYGSNHQLEPIAFTQQGLFLMGLGLGDRLLVNNLNEDLKAVNTILQRREALHALMNPMGLGGFKVLLQGKSLTESQKHHPFQGFKSEPLLGFKALDNPVRI